MSKTALITGITGQDGAYLAELLLDEGLRRPRHQAPRQPLQHRARRPPVSRTRTAGVRFFMHYGDMTDATNLIRIIQETQPDEIYNLAAQSHVQVSFETPEYTANSDALGTLRLLEAMRILGLKDNCRFYQASTSEMFGQVQEVPQRETHAVLPAQPVRRRQGLRLLDHRQLPRGLRHPRLQRHPVQPREPHPRRDLRDAQDHARRGAHRARPPDGAVPRQPGLIARLGPRRGLRARHAPDAAAGRGRTTTSSPPASSTRVREFTQLAFAEAGVKLRFEGAAADEVGVVDRVRPSRPTLGKATVPRPTQAGRGRRQGRPALLPAH